MQTYKEFKPYTLWGRVQRLFGTYIPPKKVYTAKKYRTLRFKVTGIIPSKKNDYYAENNYRMIMNKAFESNDPKKFLYENLKAWIRGSKKYLAWVDDVRLDIWTQKVFWEKKYDIQFPIKFASIKTYYFFADEMARDYVNKDESVYDMLVTHGVIADDSYQVLYKTASDGGCYKGEIPDHITTIDITVPYF